MAPHVRFEEKKRTVIDGPFAEAKESVAGFRLWQVNSMDEAIIGEEEEMEILLTFFPKRGGRSFDAESAEDRLRLGRIISRCSSRVTKRFSISIVPP